MRILVLGCGVSGLTCAIRLQEAGHQVEIWAKELPSATTSDIAGAVGFPHAVAHKRVNEWVHLSARVFQGLANDPASGVRMIPGLILYDEKRSEPAWQAAVKNFRKATRVELPKGYADGDVFDVPLIEMPKYMPYLLNRFGQHPAAKIYRRKLDNKTEVTAAFLNHEVIINCTGLGAGALFRDNQVRPNRGQIVRIKPNGFDRFVMDEEGHNKLTYIIPREKDIVLGGTDESDNWDDQHPSPQVRQDILARCADLYPEYFHNFEFIEDKVGLRPARTEIRLELEWISSRQPLVHNYGHGGAGITLSWGCAAEVAKIVGDLVPA